MRPHVDVHKGARLLWTHVDRGSKKSEFLDVINGWPPNRSDLPYLTDLSTPSVSARSNRHLRSAEQGLLHVPLARTSAMQSRVFSVVGPLVRNGLLLARRSLPGIFSQKFLQQLKTTLLGRAGVVSASE